MENNIFNAANYLSTVMWYDNIKSIRKRSRGFAFIETTAADICFNFNRPTNNDRSIVEFGIGGGGTIIDWAENFRGTVYGLEKFDPFNNEQPHYNDEVLHRHSDAFYATAEAIHEFGCKNVVLEYGRSGYDRSAAEHIFNINNHKKISMVIDDGDTDTGALLGLVPAWKDFIDEEMGIIITETPFGNGIDSVFNMPHDEKMMRLEKLSKEQHMVIFDTKDMVLKNDHNEWQPAYPLYYLGVHCANWENYESLFNRFGEHIIFGMEHLQQ